MQLTPIKDDFVWEVMNAEKWLEQLDIAISSGEMYIEELGLLISRYPNAGYEAPYYESAADLLLEHLLPHRHPEAMALLDKLHKAHGPKALDALLGELVRFCAEINDVTGVKEAHAALLTPTSNWRRCISDALRQLGRKRGGMAPKKKQAVEQYIRRKLAENPSMTSPQIWQSIASEDDPDDLRDPLRIGEYELSRVQVEGKERLVQRHTRIDKKPAPLSYNRFRQYVTEAKKIYPGTAH
jgi:hypothetical protein